MLDVGRHPNIELLAYSEVENLDGEAGDFTATIRKKARYVEEDKCTGCGECAQKCPSTVPDAFNEGLASRKAIYSWFAQGIPSTHTIDPDHCRQLQGKKCGICAKTCKAEAINFEQTDRLLERKVGAVIVATGYTVFDPARIPEYRYRDLPNVVTAMEFERMLSASGPTAGHLERPSDRAVKNEIADLEKQLNKARKALDKYEKDREMDSAEVHRRFTSGELGEDEELAKWARKYEEYRTVSRRLENLKAKAEEFEDAKKLAFIQCVGSRDLRFYPFCSGYCCMHSIKEAIIAHEHEPSTQSTIFGMDIRAVGKGFEEYKLRGQSNANITCRRARVAEIDSGKKDNPVVVYEDTLEQKVKREEFDLVVLATACAPHTGIGELAETLGLELDQYGFFKTQASNPLDTSRPGVFVCGCVNSPMDIPESVAQASSAAARTVQVLYGLGKEESERAVGKAS
jgi:heterodisulfide reductase subunit A